jgi:hypothetical protein
MVFAMSIATSSREGICGSFRGWRALGMTNCASERRPAEELQPLRHDVARIFGI